MQKKLKILKPEIRRGKRMGAGEEAENLTLEKLKIHERLSMAEGQLSAIRTLLEEELKRVGDLTDRAIDGDGKANGSGDGAGGGGIGKSIGVAALLCTVLVAVLAPIHQKIDFVTKLIDGINGRIQSVSTMATDIQADNAVLRQKFIETDGKFSSLDERTKRIEETTSREDGHIREMMEVKLKAQEEIQEAKREMLEIKFERDQQRNT